MVPARPDEIKLASVPPPGGLGYGEFDLGSESSSPSDGEFDIAEAKARPSIPGGQPRLPSLRPAPADSSHEFKGLSTSRGDESTGRGRTDGAPRREKLELAIDPQERQSQAGHIVDEGAPGKTGKKTKAFGGWRRLERQSRKVKLALLGGLLFVVAAGVGMHWTPLGLFGTQAIIELLPNSMANKIIREKEVLVSEALAKDDYRDCQTIQGELSVALGELPREEDLRLLGVFLIYYMDARFGEDKRLSDEAVKLLGGINLDKSKSKWAPLVQAARDVKVGTYDPGRLQPPDPSLGNHLLALQVISALKKADSNTALPLAQNLVAAEKNAPRAKFLLARSMALAGKVEDTIGTLDSLLSVVPKHQEGAALLARVLLDMRPLPVDRIQQVAEGVVAKARPSVAAQGRAVLARLHYNLRHFKEAKQQAEQALAAQPDEPLALIVSGDIALHEGDTVSAATMFHKALARAPKDLSASLGLAEVKLHEGKLTEAKDAVQALVTANPGSARAHYVMGLALDALEPTDEARAELLKAIELDSEGLDAYLALARSYMKSKRDSDAMAALDKAAETLPGNPLIARTLAEAQGARGDYAAAIVELNKAVEMAPDDPETYFMMAQMYRKMGSFVDARNTLAEVERRATDFPGLVVERGLVMELEGDLAGALKEYEKALAQSPESPAAKIRVGAVAHALGENAKAEKVLAEAVSALPNSAEASYLLGEVYRVTKRPSEAMRLFQVAKELDRSSGLYALRYGMSLLDLGDHVGAKRAFEEAKAKAPELAEVYLMIGEVLLVQGAARDAIESAQTALRLQPTLLEAHRVLGRAYEELSDFRAARTHYRVAAKALTEDGELHFLLGLAELKMSGERASLPPLERALTIVEQAGERPAWLSEALFRLGMAQVAVGQRGAAIASWERYFEVAPENHIDRAEVRANLERLRN
jgi:tetratricopeptide (TPR) repeat protein